MIPIGIIAISITTVVIAALAYSLGVRWLARVDYRADLAALKADYERNVSRTDKAISNLASQTQESLTVLEKKQNTLLSGGMLRPQQGRRLG